MNKVEAIFLEPVSPKSFKEFKHLSISNFVQGRLKVEPMDYEDAWNDAEEQFRNQLAHRNQWIKDIYDKETNRHLGWNWTAVQGEKFHHLHLIVRPKHKRRGVSRLIALMVDQQARQLGFDKVWGHVFAREEIAIKSHLLNGFKVTSYILMREVK